MTGFQNLHTHTTYCDGALSPEEMIKAALNKGLTSIGFSEHSYVPFDIHYSMGFNETQNYINEINSLKEKYDGKIEVFLGLEQDYYTQFVPDGLDYTIGTLHYTCVGGEYASVDAGTSQQKLLVERLFGGDFYAFAEDYYSVFSNIAKKTNADIIGHFDLVSKYNLDSCLFDEMNPRYLSAATSAMDEILNDCNLFEVNTGAMYRLGKPYPYPSHHLLKHLKARGGEVILSSDTHDPNSLGYMFPEMLELLKTYGFKHIKRLTKSGFINVDI